MQFQLEKNRKEGLFEQAFLQLLTALHMGRVGAGDRLPSVRQTASRNRVNSKTVFAIYQRLNAEGYVSLRPGSGAYISRIDNDDLEQAYSHTLLKLVKSNLLEAERLRISHKDYIRLLQNYVERSWKNSKRLVVIECNEEQVGVFTEEISRTIGCRVEPLLLRDLESNNPAATSLLKGADYLVTTHFHYKQVSPFATHYQKKLLQLSLNPAFVPTLVDAARTGPVLMVVSNENYFPAFSKSLLSIGTPAKLIEMITAVDQSDPERIRTLAARSTAVYVSPICSADTRQLIPAGVKILHFANTLSIDSLELLESVVVFGSRGDRVLAESAAGGTV